MGYIRLTVDFYTALHALPLWASVLLAAIIGGLSGSFMNMLIWRLPRRESIFFPRSHCPVCGHNLGVSDLVPLLSYIFLRGRCAYCNTGFGPRYFFVELLCVFLSVTTYLVLDWTAPFLLTIIPLYLLIVIIGIIPVLRAKRFCKRGFTFIEIMLAGIIVGAIIIPFGNMFLSSYSRVLRNKQYTIGYNLLEEKMEELKLVPFARLKSDWNLYANTEDRLHSIFADEHIGPYQKMKVDEEYFTQNFTDVYTEKSRLPDPIFKHFVNRYQSYYGFDYRFYPEDYDIYRRTVKIEPVSLKKTEKFSRVTKESRAESSLVKITVTVWIDSNLLHRKLELSAYRKR
jgi:prepilin signal peptidase PulO-like enzyme (type II secretory pathway)